MGGKHTDCECGFEVPGSAYVTCFCAIVTSAKDALTRGEKATAIMVENPTVGEP